MSDGVKLGPIIDGLDITVDFLRPGDIVSDAVVLLKIVDSEGGIRLASAHGPMSWIERQGMLRVAEKLDLDQRWKGEEL
jgi:hypothetical protein